MQRKFLFLFFLMVSPFLSFSQTADLSSSETESGFSTLNESWSLYADEENKLYYIDFETLSVNLNDIVVKNQDGDILFKDDVFELPVNTIYELNLSQFQAGTYFIELRAFTGIIRKTLTLK